MERGNESAKRQAKEEVPGDRIKDAPALARELRWRVRHAAGYSSEDESRGSRKTKATVNGDGTANGIGNKRKRIAMENSEDSLELFRNFKRPSWDRVEERPTEKESRTARIRKPDTKAQDWAQAWVSGSGDAEPRVHRCYVRFVQMTGQGLCTTDVRMVRPLSGIPGTTSRPDDRHTDADMAAWVQRVRNDRRRRVTAP